jgi:hypothetical protein
MNWDGNVCEVHIWNALWLNLKHYNIYLDSFMKREGVRSHLKLAMTTSLQTASTHHSSTIPQFNTTPPPHNKLLCIPLNDTSSGIFGNGVFISSFKSSSFSSMKCSSRPPPDANRKGMLSCVENPYSGWKRDQSDIHNRTFTSQTTNSVDLSPRANYTDWATATCQQKHLLHSIIKSAFKCKIKAWQHFCGRTCLRIVAYQFLTPNITKIKQTYLNIFYFKCMINVCSRQLESFSMMHKLCCIL